MKQNLTIKVPKDYSAVTLKKYLEFREAIQSYEDEPEAVEALAFNLICDVPVEYIYKIDSETFGKIREDLAKFLSNADYKLQRFITIDGKEYGFEPNLSQMSYGAYLDCTKYDTITIDRNWAKIMSILYRPVTKKVGLLYEIEPYNALVDEDKFLNTTMDIHFGALFFFKSLLEDLQKDTLNSLMELTELPRSIKSTLEKSGVLTHQLSNWHKTIS